MTEGPGGWETVTGLEAFEEWESGLEDTKLDPGVENEGSCGEGWCGIGSLSMACCVNITGDPGDLWCGLSSFKCIGTGIGDATCCAVPEDWGSAVAGGAPAISKDNPGN